jgi:hypothetical protein
VGPNGRADNILFVDLWPAYGVVQFREIPYIIFSIYALLLNKMFKNNNVHKKTKWHKQERIN